MAMTPAEKKAAAVLALVLLLLLIPGLFYARRCRQAEEPVRTVTLEDYVLNNGTGRFHRLDCSSVAEIKPENREDFFGFRDDLIDMGYTPCAICKP